MRVLALVFCITQCREFLSSSDFAHNGIIEEVDLRELRKHYQFQSIEKLDKAWSFTAFYNIQQIDETNRNLFLATLPVQNDETAKAHEVLLKIDVGFKSSVFQFSIKIGNSPKGPAKTFEFPLAISKAFLKVSISQRKIWDEEKGRMLWKVLIYCNDEYVKTIKNSFPKDQKNVEVYSSYKNEAGKIPVWQAKLKYGNGAFGLPQDEDHVFKSDTFITHIDSHIATTETSVTESPTTTCSTHADGSTEPITDPLTGKICNCLTTTTPITTPTSNVKKVVVNSVISINTEFGWREELSDPQSQLHDVGGQKLIPLFHDKLYLAGRENEFYLDHILIVFTKGTPRADGLIMTDMEMTVIYSRVQVDDDDLEEINRVISKFIIGAVGDSIKASLSFALSPRALAQTSTTTYCKLGDEIQGQSTPIEATNIGFTIFTKDPCPSEECWVRDYESGVCIPKASCASINCSAGKMGISFDAKLFGEGSNFEGPPGFAGEPKLNDESGRFEIDCILGDCGMKPKIVESDLQYTWTWSSIPVEKVNKDTFGSTVHTQAGAHLTWTCMYSTRLEIASNKFIVDEAVHEDSITAYGNLEDAFSIKMFSDKHLTRKLGDSHFLGQSVYAETKMNVIKGIQFYIDSCTISEEQESVNIVLNNCYARALGAKLVSDTHLTATSSVLTYSSFTFSKASISNQYLSCSVRICLEDDDECNLTKLEQNCPSTGVDGLFDFTLDGK